MSSLRRAGVLVGGLSLLTSGLAAVALPAQADVSSKISAFPYSQTWSDAGAISVSDDWTGVPGVQGYRGDDLTTATGTDPQGITADGSSTPMDVNADTATTSTTGGVLEIDGDTIAMQGSGTADAPQVVFRLDLTGRTGATFSFDARDLDVSADDATQQIAVQYRVGTSGAYTNLPTGYIADATAAGAATLVTHKDVTLPAAADGQADLFVRVLTTNAVGNDELVGIDNIAITTGGSEPGTLAATDPADVTATVGEPISPITLAASGGTSPYSWSVSGLPAGLSESNDGVIEGTPTEEGTSTATATVTDSATPTPAVDSVDFTITVTAPTGPTSIAEIQGTGATTPLAGETVTTRGVVTAAYPTGDFFAFVIQTEGTGVGTDATPGASDALWVFQSSSGVDAAVGQFVEVKGTVAERFGRTQLTYDPAAGALKVLTEPFDAVSPLATGYWPTEAEREAHESELLDVSAQEFTVTNNFATNRFGEIGLATGDRPLVTPTEVANPNLDAAGYQAALAENFVRGVVLDDGADWDYLNDDFATDDADPWIDRQTTARVGASAALTGPVILDYGFGDWRFQPTSQVIGVQPGLVTFGDTRPENTAPQPVGGDLKIATFNVLNYFNTTGADYEAAGGSCSYFEDRFGEPVTNRSCSDNGPRGAADDEDLARQQVKIVEALNTLYASVVALEEIENSAALGEDRDDALSALTDALNTAAGEERWAFVPSPPADQLPASEDVIRTAFIYDPTAVELEGESVIFDGPAFNNARQPLAQAFRPAGTTDPSDAFAVFVNHFKSKGSACTGEPNGPQGNCNQSRIAQAGALADFADEFAEDRGLEQVYLTGDFNSYTEEDPMIVLERAGYTALDSDTPDEWSYSFDGMSGSLDHVLANDAALAEVAGVDIWEINANEALAFEYSRFNYNVTEFYEQNVFRASDHNPELVGIDVRDASDVALTLSPSTIKQKKETSTASVTVDGVDDQATGVVRFLVDGVVVGQRSLLDGTAELPVGPFGKGRYIVTVEYLGDDDNLPGSDDATLVVGNG